MRILRIALTAACFLLPVVLVAWVAGAAKAGDVHSLNRLIDETNFIVGQGCSGTLISLKEKIILTNHHCISRDIKFVEREEVGKDGTVKKVKRERRERVTVSQQSYKGHEQVGSASYTTEIVAYRQNRDIALLKMIGDKLPSSIFAPLLPDDEPILRGEPVFVVGNPRMLDATVTSGIVSSVTRTFRLPWAENEDVPMLQVSAAAHPGNSGGALYNAGGYLIGIPAAGYGGAETLSLAIPIDQVKEVLRDNCLASIFDELADDAACQAEKDREDTAEDLIRAQPIDPDQMVEVDYGFSPVRTLKQTGWAAWFGVRIVPRKGDREDRPASD